MAVCQKLEYMHWRKELNLSSKDLLQKMAELNIDVKNHMSTLEPEDEKKR